MSIVGHRRRLERLELRSGSKRAPWVEAVYEAEREVQATRKAVAALVEFALVLAGTDKIRPAALVAPSGDRSIQATPTVIPAPPPRTRRWGRREDTRPGPHDVLTWDEAIRVPWIEGA